MSRILIAGCGFLGEAAALFFQEAGHEIVALTASESSARTLATRGIPALAADLSSPEGMRHVAAQLSASDPIGTWIHCASSRGGGAEAYQAVYLTGSRNLRLTLPEANALFVSSTSVYAQTDGSWVDETSPALPGRETGKILRQTEDEVLSHGGKVARLAGIYGPGRSVLLRKFLADEARIEDDGHRWINQIHRDDAARAILRIFSEGSPGGIYNVADGHPWMQKPFYEEMARLLGRPVPPDGPADHQRKRGWTSKRVTVDKLRHLGWQPRYPDYFAALPELLPRFNSGDSLP